MKLPIFAAVPSRTRIQKKELHTAPHRVLGQHMQVLYSQQIPVNKHIQREWLDVCHTDPQLQEEHGCMLLLPVDDSRYCLHLTYVLQQNNEPINARLYNVQFLPEFFDVYPLDSFLNDSPFKFDRTTEEQFTLCGQTHALLSQLNDYHGITPFLASLQLGATCTQLLRRAMECVLLPFTVCQVPACRFLAYDSEREKVMEAQRILDKNEEQPISIKELSRMVAMNECYLKKGFKTLVGKSINEYQQHIRIAKAKELLKQQSVSEVAAALGYSSISHFSTSFKKATGMKPCELLQ